MKSGHKMAEQYNFWVKVKYVEVFANNLLIQGSYCGK